MITSRYKIQHGDCLDLMATMDESADSIVTDPPYGLKFMGKDWDHGVPGVPFWKAALRVCKPGAFMLAFGGTRTFHRLACAIEEAGWELRDTIMWVYGCLSEDTEVLVDGQWEPYHKAIAGRLALCYDKEHDTYSWQSIEKQVIYDYDETAYQIIGESTDQIVSRNHRCIIDRGNGWEFVLAEEAARESEVRVPVLQDVRSLLEDVSGLQSLSGCAQQDVFSNVPRQVYLGAASRQANANVEAEGYAHYMPAMRQENLEAGLLASEDQAVVLQPILSLTCARRKPNCQSIRPHGDEVSRHGLEGCKESRMERRRNLFQNTRTLQGREIRSLSSGVLTDGSQRWVRDGASTTCCDRDGQIAFANGGCPSRRSQADEQRSEQPCSLLVEQRSQAIRASRFTTSDLARIIPIHYVGKVWCIKVPTGAFVARRNGKVFVTGNSGFPKSHESLKPSWEPIMVCRKPLEGTVAENVQQHGTGSMNIDACRVEANEFAKPIPRSPRLDREQWRFTGGGSGGGAVSPLGRWPANVIHDGSDEVLTLFPETSGGGGKKSGQPRSQVNTYGVPTVSKSTFAGRDTGSAARFFYCAKASQRDRNEGLSGKNRHPTVKPESLMRYLCRLVTPPDGLILDPFCGSGSTGKAAVLEGFRFLGMELDAEYVRLGQERIMAAMNSATALFDHQDAI